MKAQINITENSENQLLILKKIATINNIQANNKENLINFAIDTAYKCVISLDDESLKEVANLTKSI
jgi:hypothetical protein